MMTSLTRRVGRQWLRDAIALPPSTAGAHVSESPNLFLASLSTADFEALRPRLKTVELVSGAVLFEVGDQINQVYFPNTGVVSLVVPLASGEMIESAMIGRE